MARTGRPKKTEIPDKQKCTKCHKLKLLKFFVKDKRTPSGRGYMCKKCQRKIAKEKYDNDSEFRKHRQKYATKYREERIQLRKENKKLKKMIQFLLKYYEIPSMRNWTEQKIKKHKSILNKIEKSINGQRKVEATA